MTRHFRLAGYIFAVLSSAIAFAFRFELSGQYGSGAPYATSLTAIGVSALFGTGPAIAAMLLSGVAALGGFPGASAGPGAGFALYLFASCVLIAVARIREEVRQERMGAAEEEARRAAALLHSGDAFFKLDRKFRIVQMNANHEKLSGKQTSEVLGRVFWDAWPETADPDSKYWTEFHRCMEQRVPVQFDDHFAPLDSWTGVRAYPMGDGMGVVFRDLSDRKRAEDALRESEERFRALLSASSDVVYRMSADGTELHEMREGASTGDTSGREWLQRYVHPDDRERVQEAVNNAIRTRSAFELEHRILRGDGSPRWVFSRAVPVTDARGEVIEWLGAARDIMHRKQAGEAVNDGTGRLEAILNGILDEVWVTDAQGNVLLANETRHPGPAPDGLPLSRALRGERFAGDRERIRNPKNGELGWREVTAGPTRDRDGRITGAVFMARDVTERARAEQALRDSEARFRRLFESIEEGLFLAEMIAGSDGRPADWRYLEVNPRMAQMLGRSRTEVIGHTYRELDPAADWERWVSGFGQVASTGVSARFSGFGGRDYDAVAQSPKAGQFAAIVTDATARRQTEEAMREIEARYRGLFESMQDGFALAEILCNERGEPEDCRYLDVNPAFESSFGRARVEVVGRRAREVFPGAPWQDWIAALGKVALTGTPAHVEGAGGRGRHFEALAYSPRRGQFAAIFADVTDRMKAGQALAERDRTRAQVGSGQTRLSTDGQSRLSREAVMICSRDGVLELNPAALALQGFSGLAEGRLKLEQLAGMFELLDLEGRLQAVEDWPMMRAARGETLSNRELLVRRRDTGREFVGSFSGTPVRGAAGEGLAIVTIRDVTGQQRRGAVEDLDCSKLIGEMRALLRRSVPEDVELRFHLAERLPAMSIDAGQLQQIVINLVINAAEAAGEGGQARVEVSTGVAEIGPGFPDAAGGEIPPGRYVAIEISDNGPGIAEEAEARLLDAFFTPKFAGRELGLAAVLGIMRMLNGTIALRSERGRGSTFSLFFRCAQQQQQQQEQEPAESRRASVIVVDDEEYVRDFFKLALESRGYRVQISAHGGDGLEAWRSGEFDVAILDAVMPGMGGILPEIRRMRPGRPILLTGDFSDRGARRLCSEFGAAFLAKPCTARQAADAVDKALRIRSRPRD